MAIGKHQGLPLRRNIQKCTHKKKYIHTYIHTPIMIKNRLEPIRIKKCIEILVVYIYIYILYTNVLAYSINRRGAVRPSCLTILLYFVCCIRVLTPRKVSSRRRSNYAAPVQRPIVRVKSNFKSVDY